MLRLRNMKDIIYENLIWSLVDVMSESYEWVWGLFWVNWEQFLLENNVHQYNIYS